MNLQTPSWTRLRISLLFVLSLMVLTGITATAYADSTVQLSKNSDFSTSDRSFTVSDTLYIKVTTDQMDPAEVEENEFELEPNGSGESVEGSLKNHLDGTFTGKVALSQLSGETQSWLLSISIEDDDDQAFSSSTNLTIEGLTDEKDFSTITGEADHIGRDSLAVAGETIRVTDSTSVFGSDGSSITVSELRAGDRLRVMVFEENDHLVARSIRKLGAGYVRLDIEGNIEQAYSDSVKICDFTLSVNETTDISGDDGKDLTLADLDSTMSVEAHSVTGTNGWVLQKLNVEEQEADSTDDGDSDDGGSDEEETEEESEVSCEYDLSGYVETVHADSGYVTIAGLTLWTSEDTEFEGGLSGLSGLASNTRVEIEFSKNDAGQWIMDEVHPRSDENEDVELSGAIQNVGEGQIQVNDATIALTDQTVIVRDHEQVDVSELYSGLKVEVMANRLSDGTLEAIEIEIEDELDEEIELEGEITAVNADSTIQVQETWVRITDQTEIDNENDASMTFGDLRKGLTAEIKAVRSLDSVLTATSVEIEDRFAENRIETEGIIENLNGSSVTLKNGRTFTVDSNTEIHGEEDQNLTIDSLDAGDYIKVKGVKQSDGSFLALEIEREKRDKKFSEAELKGTVDAVNGDSITVNGTVFTISAENTAFEGVESVDQLQSGDVVEVQYRKLSDGTLIVRAIELEDGELETAELEGVIDSVSTDFIVVAGIEVQLADSTKVRSDSTMSVNDLKAGMSVEIEGYINSGGQITADVIAVEELDIFASAIDSTASSGTSITVAGKTVNVDDETFIFNQNGNLLQPSELSEDMFVQVVSVTSSETKSKQTVAGTSQARRIEVLNGTSTATGIEKNPQEKPSAYTLHNNYPNPFNPTTNIRYELRRDAHVTLRVYNVLGRKVAELVDRKLQAGNHTVTWNATNMASGTYFVRMKVRKAGSVVSSQTTKMMLLK